MWQLISRLQIPYNPYATICLPASGGGVIRSNHEFAPSVDNRSVILSNYFLLSLAVEGLKADEGGTNNPHCNANEFRSGWGGCRVATRGVNPNTSNLVAMITSKEGGYKALHFQSCSNDYKCERMV